MIINVPITIDEKAFEEKMIQDIENKVVKYLSDRISEILRYKNGYRYATEEATILDLAVNAIDRKIDSIRDEIIETASKELANKLARSKKGKEILGNLE